MSPKRKRAAKYARPARAKKPARELTTILDFVRYAVSRFRAAKLVFAHGTTDPVAEAAFLVGEALHLPPERFDAFSRARVTGAERAAILRLIEARVRSRKPAAYLVRRAYIQGVPFYVDERVIVPRSYLGELLAGDLFAQGDYSLVDPGKVTRVLDLCTGSGCLAILAALRFPDATVDAVDTSKDALDVARINVANHGLEKRVRLLRGDLYKPLGDARYDLILANPPYVDAAGMAGLPPECLHEPRGALAGGADGIAIVRRIIAEAPRHLRDAGGLLCEVGRTREAIEGTFPTTPFLWLDTEESSGEVFWLDAKGLRVG
ncbi:MAG: ribosomal protein glutamine methyltransferase [Alphaproteobacteria bacterium]|nr:ribosomal protein glutamine methyltransferase [Alphaproteobacteria bacterium]